jgi:hypothetical protein
VIESPLARAQRGNQSPHCGTRRQASVFAGAYDFGVPQGVIRARFSTAGVQLRGGGPCVLDVAPELHRTKSCNSKTKECRHERKP